MEWISVKDKLPNIDQDVLVWVAEDFNCYDVGRFSGRPNDYTNGWDTNNDLAKYRQITHWQLLPEPPKL